VCCFVYAAMSVHGSIDSEGLNAPYDAHARDLLGYLPRRSADAQTALDLLSATFLAALENRGRCRATDERGRVAWLYRIAANTFVDYVRRGAAERRAINRLGSELRALTPAEVEVIKSSPARASSRRA
jgi:RNA polymerase sigma-70 factor (ECF subfamily)